MDDIIAGEFSRGMMADWAEDDAKLFGWREETGKSAFENALPCRQDRRAGVLRQWRGHGGHGQGGCRAGVETMVASGIYEESAYYESLHELPLIANTVARKRLYEMNVVISDTAEYGNYLFANAAVPLLREHFMPTLQAGTGQCRAESKAVDNLACWLPTKRPATTRSRRSARPCVVT